jgi:hypothetical protein
MFSAGVKEDDESSVGEKERKKASLTGARFAKPVMQPAPSRKRPALIKSAKPPSTAKLSSEVKRESLWKEKAMSAQVPPNRRDFTGFGHICEELLDGGSREGAGKVACKRRAGQRKETLSRKRPRRKADPPGVMTIAKSAPHSAACRVNSIVSLVELAGVPAMSGMAASDASESRT